MRKIVALDCLLMYLLRWWRGRFLPLRLHADIFVEMVERKIAAP